MASDGTFVRIRPVSNRPRALAAAAFRPAATALFISSRTRDEEESDPPPTPERDALTRSLANRSTLLLALALAALAALLCSPAPSLARHVRATHASTRSKAKGRHAKRRHHAKKGRKHKGAAKHQTLHVPAPAPTPAVCADGSRPVEEGESGFACANGAEPVCANGAEPAPAHGGSKLLCPAAAKPTIEWEEAECEDGSAPERSEGGGFACEDGSRPSCENGVQPTLSDDGSMLVCITHGATSSSPPPSEEVEEDEDEGDTAPVRTHLATGS
jgi:hypothetical protein